MASSRRYNTCQTGEALVAAEFARRNFTVGYLTGNAPNIDLLAYKDGKSVSIQVKAISKGGLQLNLGRFLDVDVKTHAPRQKVMGPRESIDPEILLVVVFLGCCIGKDRFYITKLGQFVRFLEKAHNEYLAMNGGQRPGSNPASLHAAFTEAKIIEAEIQDKTKEGPAIKKVFTPLNNYLSASSTST